METDVKKYDTTRHFTVIGGYMFCVKCGNKLLGSGEFCTKCGIKSDAGDTPSVINVSTSNRAPSLQYPAIVPSDITHTIPESKNTQSVFVNLVSRLIGIAVTAAIAIALAKGLSFLLSGG